MRFKKSEKKKKNNGENRKMMQLFLLLVTVVITMYITQTLMGDGAAVGTTIAPVYCC